MPGRPKTRAREFEAVEEAILTASMGIWALMPQRFLDAPDDSELCNLWLAAKHHAMACLVATEQVGDALRTRAGLPGPGPIAQLLEETG
jgi:hypothetical protein